MQDFVDTVFSKVDGSVFHGIRFVCASPVEPPSGFEDMWGIISPEDDMEETDLSDGRFENTSAVVAVTDVSSQSERAALASFACRACGSTLVSFKLFLLPRIAASGEARLGGLAFIRRMVDFDCIDDVLWGPPAGFELALSVKAKLLSHDAEFDKAREEYCRRAVTKAANDRIVNTLDSTYWEYLCSRHLHNIPEKQESEQLDERLDRVAGLKIGKKVMRWLFGFVCVAAPQAPLVDLGAADAHGEHFEGEGAPITQIIGGAADDATGRAAHLEEGAQGVQQLLQGGEMTSLFMIRKRDIKSMLSLRMIDRYLNVMTRLRQFPHPNLPQLVRALHSPCWLYVQLQQSGTRALICALKMRDDPQHCAASERIDTTVIVDIIDQLSQAVCHLHQLVDIVHRDIKPEVIMLEDKMSHDGVKHVHATLSGFELASQGRRVYSPCGTMPFAAPEVMGVYSEGYDSMKADMWSLGITFLELMCGLRCVELAMHGNTDMGATSESAANPSAELGTFPSGVPFKRIREQTTDYFDKPGCIDTFLSKSLPESEPLKGCVFPLFVGLVQVAPEKRFEAPELLEKVAVFCKVSKTHRLMDARVM